MIDNRIYAVLNAIVREPLITSGGCVRNLY